MKRASIDLGTNTCLLLIAECDSVGRVSQVYGDYAEIVKLGQGVDQYRRLHPDAMERTFQCLKNYQALIRKAGVNPEEVVCVGTASARDSENGKEFFKRIEKELGFSFRVLSGNEEAKASFLGSLIPGRDPKTTMIIDIGGGSTEFQSLEHGISLQMGSVRFTERYLRSDPPTEQEIQNTISAIDETLSQAENFRQSLTKGMNLVAVAGTATTLASLDLQLEHFDPVKIDQTSLSIERLQKRVQRLKQLSIEQRRLEKGMEPKRADVILAGALILWRSVFFLGMQACQVSSRGLRYGVFQLS